MQEPINQAVVFTKPLHHLDLPLSPDELAERTKSFLGQSGFSIVLERDVDGNALKNRKVIRQHYLMYSKASYIESPDELELSDEAKTRFGTVFGRSWQAEVESGRIMGNPTLLKTKGIDAGQLFSMWNERFVARRAQKIQDGVLMAWLDELDCYCINAFYPAMEANFYNPKTHITYYVIEFDPARVSWKSFRKVILGATDSSKADPASFRGRLYAEFASAVAYPVRDNFVHGSAGPFEGLVERSIHEPDFELATNPVGRHLAGRGVTLEALKAWKTSQSIAQLGGLFDATEERDTAEILGTLDALVF